MEIKSYENLCNRSRLSEGLQEEVEDMGEEQNTAHLRGGCDERVENVLFTVPSAA